MHAQLFFSGLSVLNGTPASKIHVGQWFFGDGECHREGQIDDEVANYVLHTVMDFIENSCSVLPWIEEVSLKVCIRLHSRMGSSGTNLVGDAPQCRSQWQSTGHNNMMKLTFNSLRAKSLQREHQHVFTFCVISPHWYDAGSWNPSSNKTRTYLFYIINIISR